MTYESKYAVGDVVSFKGPPSGYSDDVYYSMILEVKFDGKAVRYSMSNPHQWHLDRHSHVESWIPEDQIIQKFEAVG